MSRDLHIYVVDDNLAVAKTAEAVLENAGHRVTVCTESRRALEAIERDRPQVVLLDLMMPDMDGFEVCRRLRENPALAELKIVICSSKGYQQDRRRAAELGADGYVQKPIRADSLMEQIDRIVEDQLEVTFWGVRGTLPRPGADSVRYGGNTSCVTVEFPKGPLFVFDAGSGIKRLGDHLMTRGRVEANLLLSHPHWDHINAIPFFTPLYIPGNAIRIMGASQGDKGVRDFVSAQMEGVYFPITIQEFASNVEFEDLSAGRHELAEVEVRTMLLSHPGNCLGYRLSYGGRSLCYVTDNELFLPDSEFFSAEYEAQLIEFVSGTDALITDTTYTDAEYPTKVGWGHSCVSQVADLAHRASVQTLYLYHHDPDQDDDAIDAKFAAVSGLLADWDSSVRCVAPREGDRVKI
jgi:CheY-like chemotaxis protein/phosphoribosyl 1,2-cyclic phosphodiesterase